MVLARKFCLISPQSVYRDVVLHDCVSAWIVSYNSMLNELFEKQL